MERCPCCKARITGIAICPRCQADLSTVLACEQMARHWLNSAIRFWHSGESRMAILALSKSLYLKQTPIALVFRDLVIREQCQYVAGLLEKKEYSLAKESLSLLNDLNPHHKLLKQLSRYSRYLWVKNMLELANQQNKTHQYNQ